MITNRNYIPPKTPVDAVPEGYCTECDGYTTNYNHRGECREHGVAVKESADSVSHVELCQYCKKPELYCDCP